MSVNRSALEIKLNEKKLQLEIEKLNLECANAKLVVSEGERSERVAKSKPSEARVYNFIGAVSEASVKSAVDVLNEWARRNKKPITIVINSPGGGIFPGVAFYDAIQELRDAGIKITTVCRGMAASMGGVLLQAGDERVIGNNSYVLIHEASSLEAGKTAELEDQLKLTKRLQERLLGILAERSTLTTKQIEAKWKKTDWWLDADDCIKLGFADRIG